MTIELNNVIPEQDKLNMGCGFKKLNGYWNVDRESKCNPDQVLDFEQTPWPYEDNFFSKITADNILEHLGYDPKVFVNILKEMYRVSKDGSEWYIQVPHHRCDNFWDDFTHVRAITPRTIQMFDQSYNIDCLDNNQTDSTFGLFYDIDIEIIDVKYNLIHMWVQKHADGLIGHKELDFKLNTLNNVVESIDIFCKVHKPGRHANWVSENIK